MSRQRDRLAPRTSSSTVNEKVELSAIIDGIKQYQDDEYNSMRAEFDRVERLLVLDSQSNTKDTNTHLIPKKAISTERLQLQEPIPESGTMHIVQNHYEYAKWMFLFLVILFFVAMAKMYLRRFADYVSDIFELAHLKN